MFPYEETEDQLSAIEDAKRDMESTRIMDRLICGDVGYGKTEVALRAAFKEVQESRQVAYLAPTTILAQQIYNTFVQRMKEFPVRVELLCRFRTPAQQKKAIEDLKKGQVDVIIGTHRILSKDVQFKNLGLLIVDEEQRFGVTHKEKNQAVKEGCGCPYTDCNAHSPYSSYEPDRNPGYECPGGASYGQNADPDICYGI